MFALTLWLPKKYKTNSLNFILPKKKKKKFLNVCYNASIH